MTCSAVVSVCAVAAVIGAGPVWGLSQSSAIAPSVAVTATPSVQIVQSTDTTAQDEVKQAELRKLDAERVKLELEAKEIERRLNARWWEGSTFSQYLMAVVITSAILFGWARTYLEPILRRESELNALAERRNQALNTLLEAENRKMEAEKQALEANRDRLTKEGKQLMRERDGLRADQESLKLVVSGLKIAIDQVEKGGSKFFSIHNSGDPINKLRDSYGWEAWSDNRWGSLGYYLVLRTTGQNSSSLANRQRVIARGAKQSLL